MAENRENRPDIFCPFRVHRVEHPPVLRGSGTVTTEEFYSCLGKRCAAYHPGGCLRLLPTKDGPEFIDLQNPEALAMIEKLTQQMTGGTTKEKPNISGCPNYFEECYLCRNRGAGWETCRGCIDSSEEGILVNFIHKETQR